MYQGLKWKTRGNAHPEGRPKVYFSCCPGDFKKYFEEIVNDLFEVDKYLAVWHLNGSESNDLADNEEYLSDLLSMQAIVIVITADFLLKENFARKYIIPFATEKHLPILLIMEENGLEKDFEEKCGKLQYLVRHNNDLSAISYMSKLELNKIAAR